MNKVVFASQRYCVLGYNSVFIKVVLIVFPCSSFLYFFFPFLSVCFSLSLGLWSVASQEYGWVFPLLPELQQKLSSQVDACHQPLPIEVSGEVVVVKSLSYILLLMVPEQVWDWHFCSYRCVFSFFVCFLSPLVWFFLWLPEEVLALLFLVHCESGDFSILMKDILWKIFYQGGDVSGWD